jgi:hypothetical protein
MNDPLKNSKALKIKDQELLESDVKAYSALMSKQDVFDDDDNFSTDYVDSILDRLGPLWNPQNKIFFEEDSTSPNIINGSDGSRIIKSSSGEYQAYLATGELAGVNDTVESAQSLIRSKSKS